MGPAYKPDKSNKRGMNMQLTPEECHPMPVNYPVHVGDHVFYTVEYQSSVPCHVVMASRNWHDPIEVFDAKTEKTCLAWIQRQLIHMRDLCIPALFVKQDTHWEGIAYRFTNPTRYPVGYAEWSGASGWHITLPNEEEE